MVGHPLFNYLGCWITNHPEAYVDWRWPKNSNRITLNRLLSLRMYVWTKQSAQHGPVQTTENCKQTRGPTREKLILALHNKASNMSKFRYKGETKINNRPYKWLNEWQASNSIVLNIRNNSFLFYLFFVFPFFLPDQIACFFCCLIRFAVL